MPWSLALLYALRMAQRFKLLSGCRTLCRCVLRILAWLPVVFVTAILLWGYYVYVYIMNISGTFPKGPNKAVSIVVSVILLLISHVILFLLMSSYIRTIYTKHKKLPQQFHLTDVQLARMDEAVDCRELLKEIAANLPVSTVSRNGSIRYCDSCEVIKPDRCHHCSICNMCVLKMDHHCPWVNNCVGYSNYKYFVLFLLYTVSLCVWFCVSGLYDFIRAWSDVLKDSPAEKFQVIFAYILSAMFGFSTSVLLGFHIYLVCWNRTTLENMQHPVFKGTCTPRRRLYHLGVKRNIQQVFGKNLIRALLPFDTSEGDGTSFPLHASCNQPPRTSQINHSANDRGTREVLVEAGHTSESEVELFTSHQSEKQPLTRNTQL